MDTAPMNALSPQPLLPPREVPGWDGRGRDQVRDRSARPSPPARVGPGQVGRTVETAAKRLIDVIGAALGLLLLSPVLLFIGIRIRRDSPGPVLFLQHRQGRHGRMFWIYKFRTMRADAESRLAELEHVNEAAHGVLFKMQDDPRVTRLGRFLRRTNLDELPQLLNVLKGEMSLVGPRPFQTRDCERLEALDPVAFARRHEFRPGLTGAWQVGRRSPVDSERLLELDLEYVTGWSLRLDLLILYRTLFLVLAGFRRPDPPEPAPPGHHAAAPHAPLAERPNLAS